MLKQPELPFSIAPGCLQAISGEEKDATLVTLKGEIEGVKRRLEWVGVAATMLLFYLILSKMRMWSRNCTIKLQA
jgi:hypothetical protein